MSKNTARATVDNNDERPWDVSEKTDDVRESTSAFQLKCPIFELWTKTETLCFRSMTGLETGEMKN
jgi:hypothetical protein